MPIGAQDPIVSHTGTGTVTVFAYDFAILAAADLKVKVAGVPVTTGFTVAGIGERDGGTVTFASPPAAAAEVLLYREITRDRATDYQYSGDLRDDVLDDDLDRVWMALQEDAELIERGVRVPLGESLEPLPDAAARANTVLTFNAAGVPMPVDLAAFIPDPEASPENIWLPSSAAMTPVVQAATLTEARAAMGVASAVEVSAEIAASAVRAVAVFNSGLSMNVNVSGSFSNFPNILATNTVNRGGWRSGYGFTAQAAGLVRVTASNFYATLSGGATGVTMRVSVNGTAQTPDITVPTSAGTPSAMSWIGAVAQGNVVTLAIQVTGPSGKADTISVPQFSFEYLGPST